MSYKHNIEEKISILRFLQNSVPNLRKTSIVVKLYCVIHHTNFHQTWRNPQNFSQGSYKVPDKFIQ